MEQLSQVGDRTQWQWRRLTYMSTVCFLSSDPLLPSNHSDYTCVCVGTDLDGAIQDEDRIVLGRSKGSPCCGLVWSVRGGRRGVVTHLDKLNTDKHSA